MKRTIKFFFALNAFFLLLISCSKDDNHVKNDHFSQDEETLKIIEKWGFAKETIEDHKDYYLVDGDIVFYKNEKYLYPEQSNTKQRRHPNSVTISNVRVFINPGMDANWRNASVQAINRWNAVNSKLKLTVTTSFGNSHIQIMYDSHDPSVNLGSSTFGRGTFPTGNGLPGTKIWVNPDFDSPRFCGRAINQNMRIANVQHEIGHNVGITHTNQSFGSLIPGTPTTDAQSVMNGGRACTINNFSSGDITAIKYLFPVPLTGFTPLYRYWLPGKDHFYTTNFSELGNGGNGWVYEGIQCRISATRISGTVPLYRYYNGSIVDHFYTANFSELGNGGNGWKYEGIAGYIYPNAGSGRIPLYRYYNGGISDHFYTTNFSELGNGGNGWKYEGIAGYVLPR